MLSLKEKWFIGLIFTIKILKIIHKKTNYIPRTDHWFYELPQRINSIYFKQSKSQKHTSNLQDSITQNSNFLPVSEIGRATDEPVDLPNFNCIAKFNDNVKAAGVTIYKT